jgi:ABC-2 type transport system permease protein
MSIENKSAPIGYVDSSGLLADPLPAPTPEKPAKPIPMIPFGSEAEAGTALEAGEIQAYYLIPADYLTSGKVVLVYQSELKAMARYQFYDFLAVNLLRDVDPLVAERLQEGGEVIITTPDSSRTTSESEWFNVLVPMLAGLGFMMIMFSTGGYLMQAVAEEKENRTMEVVLTSVSPNQFMAGKIIGDISIGFTQILFWATFITVAVLVWRDSLPFLQGVRISAQTLLLLGLVMIPSFVMVAALMAMVGATVTEAREGQQVTGLIALPVWIPYMLMAVMFNSPNAPIAVLLSLLPMTAPLTMLIRDGLTILPAWQIALSSIIQIASTLAAIWLAGRAFRLGMLRYGQRLRVREIFSRQKA